MTMMNSKNDNEAHNKNRGNLFNTKTKTMNRITMGYQEDYCYNDCQPFIYYQFATIIQYYQLQEQLAIDITIDSFWNW